MKIYECVSFLLTDHDNVLLEKRSLQKASDPGLIAIPGGHIEPGENQQQALIRELDEELAIRPLSSAYLCTLYHPTKELQLIHYYVISAWEGEIQSLEADEVFWHSTEKAPIDIPADKTALAEYLRLKQQGLFTDSHR